MADVMINKVYTVIKSVARNHPRTRASLSFVVALCLLPCHAANAEALRDPTRPPNMQSIASDTEIEVARSGPQLQAVIISENRRSAIISNRRFNMGDSIGGAQLITINESEVVLRTGDRLKTLKLFPSSSKRRTTGDRQATR